MSSVDRLACLYGRRRAARRLASVATRELSSGVPIPSIELQQQVAFVRMVKSEAGCRMLHQE